MHKALLTFSNGKTLELCDEQLVIPISRFLDGKKEISVSKGLPYELWYHVHDGLIPSIAELLCKSDFFQLPDNENKIYSSSAVVSVENL